MSTRNIRVELEAITAGYERNMKSAADSTGFLEKRVQGLANTIAGTVRKVGIATAAMGVGAALGVKTIIDAGAQYQTSMNQVRAVTGAVGAEFDALSSQAKSLGASTKFTAGEAADAMYFLSSAGFEVNEVMSAMPGVLQLAAAGNMDIATTADIASNVLSGYAMEVHELQRVNDVLAVTFTNTNTNIAQMGEAMQYVAPVAAAAGIEFEETAAALGLLGNAGIQSSMAGTTLRGVITNLLTPTQDAEAILDQLGVTAVNSSGGISSLADIVDQLALSGATTGEMMTIFGQRAGPGMAALVSQGAEALRTQTVAGLESAGTAAGIAEIQMEGFEGAMLKLKSAVEGIKVALYEAGIDRWAEMTVNGIRRVVSVFEMLPGPVHTMIAGLMMVVAVGGTVVGTFAAVAASAIAMKIALNLAGRAMDMKLMSPLKFLLTKLGLLKTRLIAAKTAALQTGAAHSGLGRAWLGLHAITGKISAGFGAMKAAMGPIGIGLALLTAGIMTYARHKADQKRRIDEVKQSLDSETGALTRNTDAWLASELRQSGALDHARTLGIARGDLTKAMQGEEAALLRVNAAINAHLGTTGPQADAAFRLTGILRDRTHEINQAQEGWRDEAIEIAAVEGKYLDVAHAIEATGDVYMGTMLWHGQVQQSFTRLSEATGMTRAELEALGVTHDMTADQIREMGIEVVDLTGDLQDATEAYEELEEAVKATLTHFSDQTTAIMGAADPLGRYKELLSETNEANRKAAEATAEATKSSKDSWEDYYTEVEASRKLFLQAQEEEIEAARNYYNNINTIREQYGTAVANFYLSLGPEYASLVQDMMEGGNNEVQKGFDNEMQIRTLQTNQLMDFLISNGRVFIDENGRINRDAVAMAAEELGMLPGEVNRIFNSANEEIELVGRAIERTSKDIGSNSANALAKALGVGVEDVVRIANAYNFALAEGTNPLIVSLGGKQIAVAPQTYNLAQRANQFGSTAHADGGFENLPGEATIRGPGTVVQWAEPETGGEAFIPLSPAKRDRSIQIWEETGRRLNAFADGGFQDIKDVPGVPSYDHMGAGNPKTSAQMVSQHARDTVVSYLEENLAPKLSSGVGWKAMWSALSRKFPNANLHSGYRPGAITATGRPSYHGMGRAIDVSPRMDIFNWIKQNYGNSREIIYSPAGGNQVHNGRNHMYTGITRANHWDHVHWAMANGGFLNSLPFGSYDNGGMLPEGISLAHNGTGKPEPVGHNLGIDYDKLASVMAKNGGNKTVQQTINGKADKDTLRESRHQAQIALMEMR